MFSFLVYTVPPVHACMLHVWILKHPEKHFASVMEHLPVFSLLRWHCVVSCTTDRDDFRLRLCVDDPQICCQAMLGRASSVRGGFYRTDSPLTLRDSSLFSITDVVALSHNRKGYHLCDSHIEEKGCILLEQEKMV